MSDPLHHPHPADRAYLAACFRDVSVARERLDDARRVGTRSTTVDPLRADLLTALEEYAAAITRVGAPVPHRLQAEIDLYHRLRNRW